MCIHGIQCVLQNFAIGQCVKVQMKLPYMIYTQSSQCGYRSCGPGQARVDCRKSIDTVAQIKKTGHGKDDQRVIAIPFHGGVHEPFQHVKLTPADTVCDEDLDCLQLQVNVCFDPCLERWVQIT